MVRRSHIGTVTASALLLLLLAGCASAPVTIPADAAPGTLPESLHPFAQSGPRVVEITTAKLESQFGCTVDYELYEPVGWPAVAAPVPDDMSSPPTVVLAHGFMRDLTAMRGWASHWASHGVRTVVVSFCNSSWFDGRHDRNALDMIAVADEIVGKSRSASPVIYAGFSAGGLAGLLAASSDPRAAAYLGLDAVDSGELAESAVDAIPRSLFLFGEPSSCNAESNMAPLVPEQADVYALRIPFATHCDFEDPYDPACERICGSVVPEASAREIRRTIQALATAWIVRGGAVDWLEADALVSQLEDARRAVDL